MLINFLALQPPSGKGGKQRSKQEVASHTNKNDPCGQTRKLATKMQVRNEVLVLYSTEILINIQNIFTNIADFHSFKLDRKKRLIM